MSEKYYSQQRKNKTSSYQQRSQPLLSLIETSDIGKIIKTESQFSHSVKKVRKSINNFQTQKKDPISEIAQISRLKLNSKIDLKCLPNLEKKTDIQRVKWFSKQKREIDKQEESMKLLKAINNGCNPNQQSMIDLRQQQQTEQNEQDFIDKYFVMKTPIKPVRYKDRSTKLITTNSTFYARKRYQLNKIMSLEGIIFSLSREFVRKNNELRRHRPNKQESIQESTSVLHQLQVNKMEHINLYSSVINGVKNDILHNQYKNGIKELFDIDDELNEQDQQILQELYKKSIFKNPFLNNNCSSSITNNDEKTSQLHINLQPNTQEENERRKNKKKRVLLQIAVFLHWMFEHRISYEDLLSGNIFQQSPYQSENSKFCFQHVKAADNEIVTQFLDNNRFLVFDFDHYKQTILHHSVIRNQPDMVLLILSKNAEQGRTPLYYGIRGRCNECVQILLFYKASPWSNKKNDYDKYLEFLDSKVRDLYKKAKTVSNLLSLLDTSQNANFTRFQKKSLLGIIEVNIYIQMIFVIFLLISILSAHEWSSNTQVKILTEEMYDQLSTECFKIALQIDGIFIMFYAPWCPHCVRLMPTWELQAQNSNVAAVNCENESRLCSRFKIKGFPSLVYLPPNSQIGYKFQGIQYWKLIGQRSNDEFDLFASGGWKEDGVTQIEILSEFTFLDQIFDYLKDPMLLGALIVIILLVIMILCMNSVDQANEKSKKNIRQSEKKEE